MTKRAAIPTRVGAATGLLAAYASDVERHWMANVLRIPPRVRTLCWPVKPSIWMAKRAAIQTHVGAATGVLP